MKDAPQTDYEKLVESRTMCTRLERSLHNAIKLIEKQQTEIGILSKELQTLTDQMLGIEEAKPCSKGRIRNEFR